jgi:hypothetical protein
VRPYPVNRLIAAQSNGLFNRNDANSCIGADISACVRLKLTRIVLMGKAFYINKLGLP